LPRRGRNGRRSLTVGGAKSDINIPGLPNEPSFEVFPAKGVRGIIVKALKNVPVQESSGNSVGRTGKTLQDGDEILVGNARVLVGYVSLKKKEGGIGNGSSHYRRWWHRWESY